MSVRLPAERRDRLTTLGALIRHEVERAESDFQSAVQHAIAAGQRLTEAKSLLRHGEWLPWLDENFPGSERTARQYIRLAANRQRIADLPTVREAVALLTQPKAEPDTAERPTGLTRAIAAREKATAGAELMDGSDDHLAAARAWIAAAEAARVVTREIGRGLLSEALNAPGPLGTALARTGAAALAYADHYDPCDDRHDQCYAEYATAVAAAEAVADRIEGAER